jgi:hypothetical protein
LVQIRTRMCVSLDGYVTTPDGWPVQVADPAWSPEAFGFVDFQQSLDAVLMGRTTRHRHGADAGGTAYAADGSRRARLRVRMTQGPGRNHHFGGRLRHRPERWSMESSPHLPT